MTVHLHSTLQIQTPDGPQRRLELELMGDYSIMDVIKELGIEIEPERLLLGLNGEVARLEDRLQDGDHVHLMLPVSGG